MSEAASGIGEKGELVDVQAMRERFEKDKVYTVAPQGLQVMLHVLLRAAKRADSAEVTKALVAKALDVAEWAWPIGQPREMEIVQYGAARIIVPKERDASR